MATHDERLRHDLCSLLCRLGAGGANNRIPFNHVIVSKQYRSSHSGTEVDRASTIRSWVKPNAPNIADADLTIGYGVLSAKDEAVYMKWTTYAEIGEKTFGDAFGALKLGPGERHLVVLNLFSGRQYRSEVRLCEDGVEASRKEIYLHEGILQQLRSVRQWVG
jgi:hypothetical protein